MVETKVRQITIVPTTSPAFGKLASDAVERLADNLHLNDRRECEAMGNKPIQSLQSGLRVSTVSWAAVDENGDLAALFGVVGLGLMSRQGAPWLLRRADAKAYKRAYLISPYYLEQMLSLYPVLTNYCGAWAHDSVRWLSRLGFVIGPPIPIGIHGEKMRRFEIARI